MNLRVVLGAVVCFCMWGDVISAAGAGAGSSVALDVEDLIASMVKRIGIDDKPRRERSSPGDSFDLRLYREYGSVDPLNIIRQEFEGYKANIQLKCNQCASHEHRSRAEEIKLQINGLLTAYLNQLNQIERPKKTLRQVFYGFEDSSYLEKRAEFIVAVNKVRDFKYEFSPSFQTRTLKRHLSALDNELDQLVDQARRDAQEETAGLALRSKTETAAIVALQIAAAPETARLMMARQQEEEARDFARHLAQADLALREEEATRLGAVQAVHDIQRQTAAINAAAPHEAQRHEATLKSDEVKNAQKMNTAKFLLIASALSAVGGMGAYFGFRHYFRGRPKIIEAEDTSIGSFLKRAKYPSANLDRLILTPELEKAVREKFEAIKKAITNIDPLTKLPHPLPLSNMMFYGDAGTGKTMAAVEFSRELSGEKLADHIIVRGPAFKRFDKVSEAIDALAAIIRFAVDSYKKTKRPVIVVFDEAETMFADRGQPEFSSKMTRDLVTTMTSLIGSGINKHIMFILSTNFPKRIDRALLNRIDESNRIRFTAPGQKEREALLQLYLDEHLKEHGFTVADGVEAAIPVLAKDIDGMVGRQISSMIGQSIYALLNRGETELTLPVFKDVIAATRAEKDYSAY